MSPELVTVTRLQLAQLLHVSPTTFDRMRACGTFPVCPVNWPGHPRWRRAAVAAWLGGEPTMPSDLFALLTLTEVASGLGIPRSTAYRNLPANLAGQCGVRVNREWRYPLVRVLNVLNTAFGEVT